MKKEFEITKKTENIWWMSVSLLFLDKEVNFEEDEEKEKASSLMKKWNIYTTLDNPAKVNESFEVYILF